MTRERSGLIFGRIHPSIVRFLLCTRAPWCNAVEAVPRGPDASKHTFLSDPLLADAAFIERLAALPPEPGRSGRPLGALHRILLIIDRDQ
jgi:hypothetical protein